MTSKTKRGAPVSGAQAYARTDTRLKIVGAVMWAFKKAKKANPALTQEVIAQKLGVSKQQVSKWLTGPGNWTLETVADLLQAMDLKVEDLKVVPIGDHKQVNFRHEWLGSTPVPSVTTNMGYVLTRNDLSRPTISTQSNVRMMRQAA
jgi:DNA-binding phage protein